MAESHSNTRLSDELFKINTNHPRIRDLSDAAAEASCRLHEAIGVSRMLVNEGGDLTHAGANALGGIPTILEQVSLIIEYIELAARHEPSTQTRLKPNSGHPQPVVELRNEAWQALVKCEQLEAIAIMTSDRVNVQCDEDTTTACAVSALENGLRDVTRQLRSISDGATGVPRG